VKANALIPVLGVAALLTALSACGGHERSSKEPATGPEVPAATTGNRCIGSWNAWIIGTQFQRAASEAGWGLIVESDPGRCDLLLTGLVNPDASSSPEESFCTAPGALSIGFVETSAGEWRLVSTCGAPLPQTGANVEVNPDGTLRPFGAPAPKSTQPQEVAEQGLPGCVELWNRNPNSIAETRHYLSGGLDGVSVNVTREETIRGYEDDDLCVVTFLSDDSFLLQFRGFADDGYRLTRNNMDGSYPLRLERRYTTINAFVDSNFTIALIDPDAVSAPIEGDTPASPLEKEIFFYSPSGNIECNVSQEEAYCQTFEPMRSVTMRSDGEMSVCHEVGCVGDGPETSVMLDYGESIHLGSFRCSSREDGVVCVTSKHGFRIARDRLDRWSDWEQPSYCHVSSGTSNGGRGREVLATPDDCAGDY
jgi:hypothetical protein